jgi:hypothetical protein
MCVCGWVGVGVCACVCVCVCVCVSVYAYKEHTYKYIHLHYTISMILKVFDHKYLYAKLHVLNPYKSAQ